MDLASGSPTSAQCTAGVRAEVRRVDPDRRHLSQSAGDVPRRWRKGGVIRPAVPSLRRGVKEPAAFSRWYGARVQARTLDSLGGLLGQTGLPGGHGAACHCLSASRWDSPTVRNYHRLSGPALRYTSQMAGIDVWESAGQVGLPRLLTLRPLPVKITPARHSRPGLCMRHRQ